MSFPASPAPTQYARVTQLDANSRNGVYYLAEANAGGGNASPPNAFSNVGFVPIKAG